MSHCAPEATLKPKRFEFTLKTVRTQYDIMSEIRLLPAKFHPNPICNDTAIGFF